MAGIGEVVSVKPTEKAAACRQDVYAGTVLIKRPARDACLCMGELPAPPALPAPHFVFLITL